MMVTNATQFCSIPRNQQMFDLWMQRETTADAVLLCFPQFKGLFTNR